MGSGALGASKGQGCRGPRAVTPQLVEKVGEVAMDYSSCCVRAKSLQSHLTHCHPTDWSPPGSSVRGVLQARTLEWVATPSSRGSSRPRDGTPVSCSSCTAGVSLPLSDEGALTLRSILGRSSERVRGREAPRACPFARPSFMH